MTDLQESLAAARTPSDTELPDDLTPPNRDAPDTPPEKKTCDNFWGPACDRDAIAWRWNPEMQVVHGDGRREPPGVWQPVCALHRGWSIDDDDQATKAGWRLRAARRDIAAVERLYAAERAVLDGWRDAALAGPRARESFLVTHLLGYLRRLRRAGADIASKKLPSVTIKSNRSQKVVIEDEVAVIAWAEANGYADKILRQPPTEILIGPSGDGTLLGLKAFLDKTKDGALTTVTLDSEKVPGIRIDDERNWGPVVTEPDE